MKLWPWLFTLCMGVLPAFASAATVEVGPMKLLLAEDGWEAQRVELEPIRLDEGVAGTIPRQGQRLTLRDADRKPLAVLLIYATHASPTHFEFADKCPSPEGFYARDFATRARATPECLLVAGVADGSAAMRTSNLQLAQQWRLASFDAPARAWVMVGYFTHSTGATFGFEALFAPGLRGLQDRTPGAPLPSRVPAPIAAWADAFAEAALDALGTWRGEIRMPPVDFK